MNEEQLVTEIKSILTLLDDQQQEINQIQEKFQVALTGILRLVGDASPTLSNLHGKTEDIKGYLIQLNTDVRETTTGSYQSIRTQLEEMLEHVSDTDRKS